MLGDLIELGCLFPNTCLFTCTGVFCLFVGEVNERPFWAKSLALFASTTAGSLFLVIETCPMFGPKIEVERGKGAGFAALRGGWATLGNLATNWTSSMATTRGPGGLPTGLAFGKADANPLGNFSGLPTFLLAGASNLLKSSLSAGIGLRV